MKKILFVITLSLLSASALLAQDRTFNLDKHSGKLRINISGVEIQGYDGQSILFSAPAKQVNEDDDSRAAGLHQINGAGYNDNTGLGISVKDKGDIVEVNAMDKWNNHDPITIKVPNTMSITVNTTSVFNKKDITIKNFKGEVEVSVMYNNVSLADITGPLNAKSVYGNLTAKFVQPIKGPVSIVSVYRFVDVSIPENLKANVSLSTNYGKIYAADGINITRTIPAKQKVKEKTDSAEEDSEDIGTTAVAIAEEAAAKANEAVASAFSSGTKGSYGVGVAYSDSDMKDWSRSDNIKGTLNGGGIDFILRSSYGKIYLRKN